MYISYLRPFISTPNRLLSWFLASLLVVTALSAHPLSRSTPPALDGPAVAPKFGKLPLSFVPNAGQTDPSVRFQAHSLGSTFFFTTNEVVFSLSAPAGIPGSHLDYIYNPKSPISRGLPATCPPRHRLGSPGAGAGRAGNLQSPTAVRLRFEGANPTPEVMGAYRLPGTVNYFIGDDPARWHTNLPTYEGIIYRDLYPGIDLHYDGTMGTNSHSSVLKGTYTIAPGADPTGIRWRYKGATRAHLDEATGDLLIELPSTNIISNPKSQLIERAPVAWQIINGQRVSVSVQYTVAADGSIGFLLGHYDPGYSLILDPTLTYSTYLGGSGYDYGYDIALDMNGNAYVTGYTNSSDFPTVNPAQPDFGGGSAAGDVSVVKLNPTGSALVYATYLGGSGNDRGFGIALDTFGNAYVTGDTTSADFPTQDPVQPTFGGGGPFEGDAFVAKLDPTGSVLVYATYLGGGGDEIGYSIALDADGSAYVTGYTSSTNFPIANAVQPDPAFGQGLNVLGDAFVTTVISASGVYTWGYSTYLGGIDWDEGHGIAVDASGNAYVTGNTRSLDFPTAQPVQPDFGGGGSFSRGDAFVTQIISASEVYTWGYSTYLGGSGSDSGYSIAVGDSGHAYVTGETASTDFPTASPLQTISAGDGDAFVTKVISASGVYTWGYSTYLGGGGTDIGRDIAVDADGNAYLTGYAFSTNFPTTDDAYDASCGTDGLCDNTGGDAFFTKLNDAGDGLVYSTYLGGGSTDFGHGIAVDTSGNTYLTGFTYSSDFPTTTVTYDPGCGTDGQCNGFVSDAFVAKITVAPDLLVTKITDPPGGKPVTQGDIISYTLATTNRGAPATNVILTDAIPPGTAYVPGSATTNLGDASFDETKLTVSVPSLTMGVTLTATFQVRVTTGFTTTITNQATLISDQVEPQNSNLVSHPVQGTGEIHAVFLPMLLKGLGEPPPPGCAPYLVATISVGDTPRGIALDPTRGRVYVANFGSDSLSVIDSNTNTVIQTITSITAANGVAYDPDNDVIWVTNYGTDQVTPIEAATLIALDPVAAGDGPWGVAYDPVHGYVYVVNNLDDSVTVVDAGTRSVVTTLNVGFSQPFHAAANPVTGKVYVTNFGDHSVSVVNGITVSSTVDLNSGDPSTQPYGVTVDETRNLVYVATVDSHKIVVIGELAGVSDRLLGWAAFRRGFGDPARPVPMRVIAVNPDIGPPGDGGHLWTTTSTADGSEADQALLIPKGWDGSFSWPAPYDVGTNPAEGIAVDRARDWVYVSSGEASGAVTLLGDSADPCILPFDMGDRMGFEMFTVP